MSKLRASTLPCAFSSALLIQGWTIASFSFRPSLVSMLPSWSDPKMRMRSSSSERKKRERPGSPWRPERPRSWLSMRRALMALGAEHEEAAGGERLFLQPRDLRADFAGEAFALGVRDVLDLLLDPHVGVAAELNVGAAAGHVGGDGDRSGNAGLAR